jgi:hypothetical protein
MKTYDYARVNTKATAKSAVLAVLDAFIQGIVVLTVYLMSIALLSLFI